MFEAHPIYSPNQVLCLPTDQLLPGGARYSFGVNHGNPLDGNIGGIMT